MDAQQQDRLIGLADRLEWQARHHVMGFWLDHGIDEECGGFWTDLGRDGTRYGEGHKWIIVQMRTVYSMSMAYAFFGERVFLDQAAQGAMFFRKHFRDARNGGWYYAVSRDGSTVRDDSKQPYGLAFVSYGLAEYARVSGDEGALRDAIQTHDLVMERCWDREHGGLPNRFSADWSLEHPVKRVDTHMHTMEGVSALYHATGDRRYLDRLNLLANTVLGPIGKSGCYDAEHGCTHEMFHMDWTEAVEWTRGATNLGHVTEAGWFIAKLAAYSGDRAMLGKARGLVDWAIRYGYDERVGGLYDYAESTGRVVSDIKTWWNQAELLGALAFLYRLTGDDAYLARLEHHLGFIEQYQLDGEYGEWYPTLLADGAVRPGRDGEPEGTKGSRWKSPYHVLQGLVHACKDLRRAAGDLPVAEPASWEDYCL
jgi:cellobiose epimerase